MIEPRPSVVQFAKAIARAERERGGGASNANVAQRVLSRIHTELGKVIGPAGFDVLLARALVLARRGHPVLTGVAAQPGGKLTGFDDAARDAAALEDGAMAIVAAFIELLVVLVGRDLAERLVRNVWPAAQMEKEEK